MALSKLPGQKLNPNGLLLMVLLQEQPITIPNKGLCQMEKTAITSDAERVFQPSAESKFLSLPLVIGAFAAYAIKSPELIVVNDSTSK
jgi:hypothetical protein